MYEGLIARRLRQSSRDTARAFIECSKMRFRYQKYAGADMIRIFACVNTRWLFSSMAFDARNAAEFRLTAHTSALFF